MGWLGWVGLLFVAIASGRLFAGLLGGGGGLFVLGALLGTIAFFYGHSLWRKWRAGGRLALALAAVAVVCGGAIVQHERISERLYAATPSQETGPRPAIVDPFAMQAGSRGSSPLDMAWADATAAQFDAGVQAWFALHPEYADAHSVQAINSHFQAVAKQYPRASIRAAMDMAKAEATRHDR